MAKKSAITGEYIITVEDSGAIRVCRIFDDVMQSLRECAKSGGFNFDPQWDTAQLGEALVNEYGDGSLAEIGEYTVTRSATGHIDTYQVYGKTSPILKKIAADLNMPLKEGWNTRQMGNKLVDFVEGRFNPDEELADDGFAITPEMTTVQLYDAFTKEFGTHLRIKKGVKRCDPYKRESLPEMPLSEAGLKEAFSINGEMTVEEVENLAADKGLKVQISTVDDWTTALPESPLDSVRFMPRNTTKEKMQEILDRY